MDIITPNSCIITVLYVHEVTICALYQNMMLLIYWNRSCNCSFNKLII